MKLRIEIDLDNAAFEDDREELPRLLMQITAQFRGRAIGPISMTLRDSNGNTVGTVEVTDLAKDPWDPSHYRGLRK